MKKSVGWAAIRETEGEDWFDTTTISTDREDCELRAYKVDKENPLWAKDNPVKYFARIEVKLA